MAELGTAWLVAPFVLARVLPAALALAVLSRGVVPHAVALSLALALTVGLLPAASVALPNGALALALVAARELAIGSAYALAIALAIELVPWTLLLSEPRAAPDLALPLARAYGLSAAWLVSSLGGLRAFVVGLAASFTDAPIAARVMDLRAFALGLVQLVADALLSAFGLALPLIVAAWVLELISGTAARMFGVEAIAAALPLRAFVRLIVGVLLLVPIAAHAPELVRGAIEAARLLTRALAR